MSAIALRIFLLVFGISTLLSLQESPLPEIPKPISDSDMTKANALAESVSATEWLGPMAPIAISPFFGITCLAGISQFGEGTFLENNQFISTNPTLNEPAVFWIFLVLTILTSLPRLTKVSKPIAQALDQVETYAGIITLLVIRFAAASATGSTEVEPVVVQMGLLSFSADILLSVAAVINIIVINTVRFFFEFLIWITPVPTLDALFEAANKSVCACLLAIYAYSPTLATIINLLLFLACLAVFRWINRRVTYARHIFCDPILSLISKSYGVPRNPELTVFNKSAIGPFPAKTKLLLRKVDKGWELVRRRMILPDQKIPVHDDPQHPIVMGKGLFVNHLSLPKSSQVPPEQADPISSESTNQGNQESVYLHFTRRYSSNLETLADLLSVRRPENRQLDGKNGFDEIRDGLQT